VIALLASAWASTVVVTYDLEQDDGGFVVTGDLGQWKWGEVLAGPGSGYDGANAWAIGLGGTYLNDATEYLEIPLPDLFTVAAPTLRFMHWHAFGLGDTGHVEIDAGFGWAEVAPVYGYPAHDAFSGDSGGWVPSSVSLDGLGASPRVRLVFNADISGVGAGWFIDQVSLWDGDVTAPNIADVDALGDTESLDGPYLVSARVSDDSGVSEVVLSWATSDEGGDLSMVDQGDGSFAASIPGQSPDTVVNYWVAATDGANASRFPDEGSLEFRVYLAAPSGLIGPEGRVVGSTAMLSWTPPASIHPVLGYEVERQGLSVASVAGTTATVDLLGGDDVFAVRALYSAGLGDASEPLAIDAVLPLVSGLSPAEAYAGDTLRVELTGEYLLLVDGEVDLDLGGDIAVGEIEVRNVDRLVASLSIGDGAALGARDVTVTSEAGEVLLASGFTVLSADDRPRLVAVEPARVTQGETGEMTITVAGEVGSAVVVDLGDGLVVESTTREGASILVAFAVAPGAALGERQIVVDDGTRVYTGLSLDVDDWSPPVQRQCGLGTPVSPWGGVVAAWLLRGRRRAG